MNELNTTRNNQINIRHQLLAAASMLPLLAMTSIPAVAEDAERPTVWIEVGSQLERATGGDNTFVAPFFQELPSPLNTLPEKFINSSPLNVGPEGKISIQPKDTDWIFSASVRYGRSQGRRNTHQATYQAPVTDVNGKYSTPSGARVCCQTHVVQVYGNYVDIASSYKETHLILDFHAGRDVGLGFFGRQGTSMVSAGIRFAQFTAKSEVSIKARGHLERYDLFTLNPAYAFFKSRYPQKYFLVTGHNGFSLTAESSRSFEGVGPSISWDASATLAGDPDTARLTFDWGVNAALLFGKQRTDTYHQSATIYYTQLYSRSPIAHLPVNSVRSRNVTVPNVGGVAGVSIRFPNAKISFGYRADVFFNAFDGGWDQRNSQNRLTAGPYASISIGLGE